MSKQVNRNSRRSGNNLTNADGRPKEVRLHFNHIDAQQAQRNTSDIECIAKLLDTEVSGGDVQFAMIIARVNELLIQRPKRQP